MIILWLSAALLAALAAIAILLSSISINAASTSIRFEGLAARDGAGLSQHVLSRNLPPSVQIEYDVEAALAAQISKLVEGYILFNPPLTMRVGRSYTVEARVIKILTNAFEEGLKGNGDVVLDQLKIGSIMRAKLTGSGFTISENSEPSQPVIGDDFAHWEWSVRPEQSGQRKLTLRVSIIVKIPDISDTVKDLPTFERDIRVNVNPVYTATNFATQNWKWVAGSIAIPIGLWAGVQTGALSDLAEWVKGLVK